jgi:hypothetical protein
MSIQRFILHGVENFPLSLVIPNAASQEMISVPRKHYYFGSRNLPPLRVNEDDDGVYIPYNPNFPAIDVVWKSGAYIFGVQIHTKSTHSDVASLFETKCRNAGWLDHFPDTVFLVYLCPNLSCMIASKPKDLFHSTTPSRRVKIGYITIAQIECLKNMQLS